MLQARHLTLRRGPRLLFEDADFQIHPGQKVGVTGANGSGKSSLFSLILGTLQPDAGELTRPQQWIIAHVAQETPTGDRPAIEYVLDGDRELRRIEADLAKAEARDDGTALADLHARYEAIDGYQARSRAARLLHGLGFRPGEETRPLDHFSGGWRMRLNLARALVQRSDLLLLDEPTNHLDLEAVIWLEGWLRCYPGTLLLISHDREFLDAVCDHIAHIEGRRLELHAGHYSDFERRRAERLAGQQAAHRRQQRQIAHMRAFVERFRAKATKARQAQSRLKALQRMEQILPAHVDSPFRFGFREPEKKPHPLLTLHQAAVGHGDGAILEGLDLTLAPGQRIGLLGPNGAGKSTFLQLLAGRLAPMAGRREPAPDLRIGYFAQHQLDQLHPEHSPLQHLLQIDPQLSEQAARDHLGGFGFSGDAAVQPTGPLSGGEKARLVLALLVWQRPNLLLLDEPTNHLDLEMRQALALALLTFSGAMVIVSHDRHLLRTSVDELWRVHDGQVAPFEGDLDDYPAWLAAQQAPAAAPRTAARDRKAEKRAAARRRQTLQPFRQRLSQAEQTLEQLQQARAELEARLAEPALYQPEEKARLKRLLTEKAALDRACAEQEQAWLEAAEALEAAESDAFPTC